MLERYAQRYREHLLESIVPFWMRHSIDPEYGGFFTCLDRDGSLYDSRKYVWLNGRQVWTLCRLYNEVEPRAAWLDAARRGLEFLRRHAFDAHGRVYFSLARDGRPAFFQRKPYAGVFVTLALIEYAKATGDEGCRLQAVELFHKVRAWTADWSALGRPSMEGAVRVRSQLADVMVIASMALELRSIAPDPLLDTFLRECVEQAMTHWDASRRLLFENRVDAERGRALDWPEGRLICPGSICEVAWFLLRVLDLFPNPAHERVLLDAIEGALDFGWDREHGGLYYFQDSEGRPPMQLEWPLKLWWVHVEAILAVLHAYARTRDDKWVRWLEVIDDYTFRRFPDPAYGEWFGYLDREGRPTHLLKGNNYKGCFHIPRALLFGAQTIESLSQ